MHAPTLHPRAERTPAQLDASLQLASPSWQPKLKDTNQSPRSQPGQPVEAPQLGVATRI